jgi:hypothetical protein
MSEEKEEGYKNIYLSYDNACLLDGSDASHYAW